MKYYGIENMDAHYMQILPELPVWTPDDEGRLIYVEDDSLIYFGSNTDWKSVSSLSMSGYSGYSGDDGVLGDVQGLSGYSGSSGTLGTSGYSGYDAPVRIFDYFNTIGYVKLPNGIIINWGKVGTAAVTNSNSLTSHSGQNNALYYPSYYNITFPVESRFTRGLLYAGASVLNQWRGDWQIPVYDNRSINIALRNINIGANVRNNISFVMTADYHYGAYTVGLGPGFSDPTYYYVVFPYPPTHFYWYAIGI